MNFFKQPVSRRSSWIGAEASSEFSGWFDSIAEDEETETPSGEFEALEVPSIHDLMQVYDCLSLIQRVWPNELRGVKVGPFELVSELGCGGMGSVWKGVQKEPIERSVAIKFIKQEAVNPQLIQRFADERQVLANLNHANIARIVDAGTTERGQLYFAMELVSGADLISYCDSMQLSIVDRIRLFLTVCDAIWHAHQKGIIHRDIKPSNILVQEVDGEPVAKVIDFGLAKWLNVDEQKSTDSKSEGAISQSRAGMVIGSLQYMSPEQTGLSPNLVDVRADVFALGGLLYELLTGQNWLDKTSSSRQETLEFIRNLEPIAPSQRVAKLSSNEQITLSKSRQTSLRILQKRLALDLDWIVLKALDKDPSERYQSVSELAADLDRYLQLRPVAARPKSVAYEFKKTIRRNPIPTLAAGSLLAVTLVGLILLSLAYWRVSAAETLATQRLEQSKKSSVILADVFADLNVNAIENADRPFQLQIAERLLQASEQVSTLDDPETVVDLQNRLAQALLSLGLPNEARELARLNYEHSLADMGLENELTRTAGRTYSMACSKSGFSKEALEVSEKIVEYCRNRFGPLGEETLEVQYERADQLWYGFRNDEARALYEEVALGMESTFGPDDFRTLDAMFGLANTYLSQRDGPESIPLLTKYCQRCQRKFRPGHPKTIQGLSRLAWAYSQSDSPKKAIDPATQAWELAAKELGTSHPLTLETQTFLGIAQFVNGDSSSGIKSIRLAADGFSKTLGGSHHRTIVAQKILARFLGASGKQATSRNVLNQMSNDLVEMHSSETVVARGMIALANSYDQLGEYRHARDILMTCLTDTPDMAPRQKWMVTNQVGEHYFSERRFEEAIVWFQRAHDGAKQDLGPDDFFTTITTADLAKALASNGQTELAVDIISQHRDQILAKRRVNPVQQKIATAQLGIVLRYHGQVDRGVEIMEPIVNTKPRLKEWNYLVTELRRGYFEQGEEQKIRDSVESQLRMIPAMNHKPGMIHKARLILRLSEEMIDLEQDELAFDLLESCRDLFAHSDSKSWGYWQASLLIDYCQMADSKTSHLDALKTARDSLVAQWDERSAIEKDRIRKAFGLVQERLQQVASTEASVWRTEMTEISRRLTGIR